MTPDELVRLTRVYKPGDRVRARLSIFYAITGQTVCAGTLGSVVQVSRANVPFVLWDGVGFTAAGSLRGLATSPESLEPVLS